MTLEAILAALHLVAVLTLVVFLSSQAALCRIEWLNAAVVRRLARLQGIAAAAGTAVIVTGLVRVLWGVKGASWYLSQPLFHLKIALVVALVVMSLGPARSCRQWAQALDATGQLPDADAVTRVRRQVMRQAHLLPVVAVIAVFWARGW